MEDEAVFEVAKQEADCRCCGQPSIQYAVLCNGRFWSSAKDEADGIAQLERISALRRPDLARLVASHAKLFAW